MASRYRSLSKPPQSLCKMVSADVLVLVVRQDLKMGVGKIASQCVHAATGIYAELIQCRRSLLRQWEQCGQAKIVVTCKNQQEMNKLQEAAESIGLPTHTGSKALADSVAGKLRLL